jgi:glycosyltransferase involved in cell wall biosynthesis
MLAIVIATYQRNDGTTPNHLTKALTSIKNQTYQKYTVFLIGDHYDDNDEFVKLATSIIDSDKIVFVNLPNAVERKKYPFGDKRLWSSGGVNAVNFGIKLALEQNYSYICRLDHDDWWAPEHLDLIKDKLNENHLIIATKGVHFTKQILPVKDKNPFYPRSSDLIHSSVCVNFRETPLRYRDVFAEEGTIYAADADLWNRMSDYMVKNNKTGYLINKVTCYHSNERK